MLLGMEVSESDAEVPSAIPFTFCTLSPLAPCSLLLASRLPHPAQLQPTVMKPWKRAGMEIIFSCTWRPA